MARLRSSARWQNSNGLRRLKTWQGSAGARLGQAAEKLAHACSTVEERPFRAAKAVPNQSRLLAAVATICRACAFFSNLLSRTSLQRAQMLALRWSATCRVAYCLGV